MNSVERIRVIEQRLQAAFSPSKLEVIDDSAEHHGHAGAAGGAGHYTLIIIADCFESVSRIEAHRKIYHELHDLIPHEVHALRIVCQHH